MNGNENEILTLEGTISPSGVFWFLQNRLVHFSLLDISLPNELEPGFFYSCLLNIELPSEASIKLKSETDVFIEKAKMSAVGVEVPAHVSFVIESPDRPRSFFNAPIALEISINSKKEKSKIMERFATMQFQSLRQ